jgi:hypothetical protein
MYIYRLQIKWGFNQKKLSSETDWISRLFFLCYTLVFPLYLIIISGITCRLNVACRRLRHQNWPPYAPPPSINTAIFTISPLTWAPKHSRNYRPLGWTQELRSLRSTFSLTASVFISELRTAVRGKISHWRLVGDGRQPKQCPESEAVDLVCELVSRYGVILDLVQHVL